VLEEGDGPSMTSDEPADVDEEESSDTREQSPPQPGAAATDTSNTSLPHTPSTEDLSTKKKTPSRIASGLRAPTAGKSELVFFFRLFTLLLWLGGVVVRASVSQSRDRDFNSWLLLLLCE